MSKILIQQKPDFQKKVEGTEKLKISEMFSDTLQGEGVYSGVPATFVRLQGCTLVCHWCFHPKTKIVKKIGSDYISNIKKGDVLLTLDEGENIVETTVQEVLVSKANVSEIYRIVFDDSEVPIFVTSNHPLYVKSKGWTPVVDIKENDIILGPSTKQMSKFKAASNNNQKNPIYLKKRVDMQKKMRDIGLIKPYIRTAEQNKNLSDYRKKNNPMKDPEIAKRNAEAHFKGASILEKSFEKIFQELELPITYTGNNQLSVGGRGKRYRFPDFIVNDTQKLIEVYDTTYDYTINGERKKRGVEWKENTTLHYQEFNYEVLFLTQEDLKNSQKLKETLFNYIYNGSKVVSISNNLSVKQKARLFKSSTVEETDVYNLKCSPHNSYLLHSKGHHKLAHNCDTLDVWNEGNEYSFEEIFEMWESIGLIERFKAGQHLIMTGGSPLKQQEQVLQFIKRFIQKYSFKPFIEIENEGVLMPLEELIRYIDCWNNSVKLANSGMKEKARYKPTIIEKLATLPNSWFKFVVDTEEDWQEILEFFINPNLIRKDQIIVMPQGQTQEELLKTRELTADLAIKYNLRFCSRLHIDLWDKKTGV